MDNARAKLPSGESNLTVVGIEVVLDDAATAPRLRIIARATGEPGADHGWPEPFIFLPAGHDAALDD